MSEDRIFGNAYPCKTEQDAGVLFKVIEQALRKTDTLTLRVTSKDGVTTFGIATADFFDCPYYIAGLAYSPCVKTFDCETEEDDMIDWLLSDIECAVGEEFEVTLFEGMNHTTENV